MDMIQEWSKNTARKYGTWIFIYTLHTEGALDKFNIIPQLFPKKKKIGIFIPL